LRKRFNETDEDAEAIGMGQWHRAVLARLGAIGPGTKSDFGFDSPERHQAALHARQEELDLRGRVLGQTETIKAIKLKKGKLR
jgi:hypothetical protein